MNWPDFKKLSSTKDDSVFKKRINNLQRKRKKRVTKEKKVYEPGEIHISDDSDDGKSASVFEYKERAKSDLDTTSTKNIRKTFYPEAEVVIEWSSDEDYSKTTSKRASNVKKHPLALSNEKVPIKRNEVVTPQKRLKNGNATCTSIQAKECQSYIIDENYAENCDDKFSSLRPSQRAQLGAGSPHTNSNRVEVTAEAHASTSTSFANSNFNLAYADIKKQENVEKLRTKKGGYLEKMRRILSSYESDRIFWETEREVGLAVPGCDAVVNRAIKSYGTTIYSLGLQEKEVEVILFNNNLERFLSESLKIKVSLEGQPLHVQGKDVYLSTNKICKI